VKGFELFGSKNDNRYILSHDGERTTVPVRFLSPPQERETVYRDRFALQKVRASLRPRTFPENRDSKKPLFFNGERATVPGCCTFWGNGVSHHLIMVR
jgi:hypothetical protein